MFNASSLFYDKYEKKVQNTAEFKSVLDDDKKKNREYFLSIFSMELKKNL